MAERAALAEDSTTLSDYSLSTAFFSGQSSSMPALSPKDSGLW